MLTPSLKLPRLSRLPGARVSRSKDVGVPTVKVKKQGRWWDDLEIVFPFNSVWEVALNILFLERDPNWLPQIQFGERGEAGSTRPDWIHPLKKIAFYLDTPVHHFRRLEARDTYLRYGLQSEGWTVIVWDVPTLDYAVENFYRWYRAVIEGKGFNGASV
jgi:hypothetical protein